MMRALLSTLPRLASASVFASASAASTQWFWRFSCVVALLGGSACAPITNEQLPQDLLLIDNDLDGVADQDLEGNIIDCDDDDPDIGPDMDELCDGIDNNCDEQIDEGFDADGDTYLSAALCASVGGGDCDDKVATIFPGAQEKCDFKDNDCDKQIDEGFDQDNDGFSSCDPDECDDTDPDVNADEKEVCDGKDNDCDDKEDEGFTDANGTATCIDDDGDGYSESKGDCDDLNKNISPKAQETCDGKDNNCDDEIDEGFDVDNDGYTLCGGDCNDAEPTTYPGATEICDAVDNNCDDAIDETFPDSDKDGFRAGCGDCNDGDANVNPGRPEQCNRIDDNCDGDIDLACDNDGDGYTPDQGDCDDNNIRISPIQEELCDGKDQNCNGTSDEGLDADGDGYGNCSGVDCDDANRFINPGAKESCDLQDNNCDGDIDEGFDQDQDGVTSCAATPDCNDSNSAVYPGASEVCGDGIDNNCINGADEQLDLDGDGFKSCATSGSSDCNDNDRLVYPGAVEVCDNKDNNCSGGPGDVYVAPSGKKADYTTIQAALNATTSGCSVVVSAGTFKENLDYKGKGIYLRSESGPDLTIIDSTGSGSLVSFRTSEGRTAILEGFTLQNGKGTSVFFTNPPRYYNVGGAIFISTGSPIIRDNVIYSNTADYGAGIYANTSSLIVEGNTFIGNTSAEYGAALHLLNGTDVEVVDNLFEDNDVALGQAIVEIEMWKGGLVEGNTFRNNVTSIGGAVVALDNKDVDILNNLFEGNETTNVGGALTLGFTDASYVAGNTFRKNQALKGGGAVYCLGTSSAELATPLLVENVFDENDGYARGGGAYLHTYCDASLVRNLFRRNYALASTSPTGGGIDVQDGTPFIVNNILLTNSALKGGAIAVTGTSARDTVILNNTFYGNIAVGSGNTLYLNGVTPTVMNNLFTFAAAGALLYAETSGLEVSRITYNDFYSSPSLTNVSGLVTSNNNLSVDPRFTNVLGENFSLLPESTVINAGNPSTTYNDLDGTTNQLGAYGGPLGGW
ncbi:MAG: MopE-related protein [Myxococcota bacterium]